MTATHVIVAVVAIVLGAGGGLLYASQSPHAAQPRRGLRASRILLPFTGTAISRRSLDAALRLARAENATLVPAFLATVPRHLPLDAAVPTSAASACRCSRRSSRSRRAPTSPSTRGSGADAPTATRSHCCSTPSRSTA